MNRPIPVWQHGKRGRLGIQRIEPDVRFASTVASGRSDRLRFFIGMTALLNHFTFVGTIEGILQSRMLVFGANIESNIQNALALGLPLAGNSGLAALMEREKAADPWISDIDVFDGDGRIVCSTDARRLDTPAPGD